MTLLTIVLVAALYFILDTQRGSDWLLTKGLAIVSPDATFTSYSGTLASGIQLKDLHLPLPAADIRIASIDSAWNLWGILSGELSIQKLHIDTLNIDILTTPDTPKDTNAPSPWPSLSLPFPVGLDDVQIRALSLRQGESTQTLDTISLQAHSGFLSTNISSFAITSKDYKATLSGSLNNRPPYKMRLDLGWHIQMPEQAALSGKGTLRGDLQELRLKHTLETPAAIRSDIRISDWYEPSMAMIDINKLRMTAKFDWEELPLPPALNEADNTPLLNSNDGQLQLAGTWQDYTLTLRSNIAVIPNNNEPRAKAEQAPPQALIDEVLKSPATLQLELKANKLAVAVSSLALNTEAGSVEVSGNIDANALLEPQPQTNALTWQLKLKANELDSRALLPQLPSTLTADIDSTGWWKNNDYQAALTINTLTGELNDKAIAGNGSITLNPRGQEFNQLALQLGDNNVKADGKLSETSELNWQLDAPDLSQIYQQLSGAISSTGNLRGNAIAALFDNGQSPVIKADVSISNLHYQQYAVANANLRLTSNAAAAVDINVKGEGISAAVLKNAQLELKGSGTLNNHRLVLQLDDESNHLTIDLSGALQEIRSAYQWHSTIRSLSLSSNASGPWQLSGSSELELAANSISLSPFCLAQNGATLCSEATFKNGDINASGQLESLPLERFTAGLPLGATITGLLNTRFKIHGKSDDISGELAVSSEPIVIRYQASEDQAAVEHHAVLTANADIQNNKLNSKALFSISDVGSINATLRTTGLDASSEIQGDINGGFSNLRWLGGLFPQLEKLDGVLRTQLSASGQLAAPKGDGNVSLANIKMELPDLGLSLQDASATLNFDSRGPWQLNSQVHSGDGTLVITGQGELGDTAGPTGEIQISGDNITALDLSDALVVVSPNINATLSPELIKIRGSLGIPKGNFTLKTLPEQAAGVSADERIVNSDKQGTKNPSRGIDTRIQITLNDSFEFKGYGLSTRLGGELKISQKPDALLQAFGSLSLYDGVYQAYGQKLAVERGLLIFQGPLDNPGLNITAVRETKTVKVGVNIGGFAQDIRSELFSNPALPPTDVMAILITGKAPSDLNKSDANQVMNAATALGISQSRGITNTLQNTFGVDVISLQGGDSYEDSSLVVGKYLTPDLFISYVQNLFTPAGSVQLDYSLTKSLGLKAQSGKAQSIDLLYKIEHGEH